MGWANPGKDVAQPSSDHYAPTLATVYVNGREVNLWLVRNGWAWTYMSKREELIQVQQEARKAERGLWMGDRLPSPWEFRRSL